MAGATSVFEGSRHGSKGLEKISVPLSPSSFVDRDRRHRFGGVWRGDGELNENSLAQSRSLLRRAADHYERRTGRPSTLASPTPLSDSIADIVAGETPGGIVCSSCAADDTARSDRRRVRPLRLFARQRRAVQSPSAGRGLKGDGGMSRLRSLYRLSALPLWTRARRSGDVGHDGAVPRGCRRF